MVRERWMDKRSAPPLCGARLLCALLTVWLSLGCARKNVAESSTQPNPVPSTARKESTAGALTLERPSAPARPFRDTAGVVSKFGEGPVLSDLSMLTDLGVRWVREVIHWPHVERKPGQYSAFSPAFTRRLAFYREHDIGIIYVLAYDNPKAYPPTEADPYRSVDPEAYGRYAAHSAKAMRAAGVRYAIEIWNEPHNFGLGPLLGGGELGEPGTPWLDHYLRMLREAVRQVRAIDPSVPILSNGDTWITHYRYLEAGLPPELTGFAVHPYTADNSLGPEMTAMGPKSRWILPFDGVDPDRSFFSAIRKLRTYGRQKLGHDPELWITEWGWRLGSKTARGLVTEERVGGLIARAYIVAAAAGVEATCWYASHDSTDGPWGLMDRKGQKRQSYFALRTLLRIFGDSVLVKQVSGQDNPTRGLQAFAFKSARDQRVALWSTDGAVERVPLRGRLEAASVVDYLGEPLQPQRDETGQSYIPLGETPVYLLDIDKSAEIGF